MATEELYKSIMSVIGNIENCNLTYFDQKYLSEGINFMIGEENQHTNGISRDLLYSITKLMQKTLSGELGDENIKMISKNLNKMLSNDINNFKNIKHLFLGWYIHENIINKK